MARSPSSTLFICTGAIRNTWGLFLSSHLLYSSKPVLVFCQKIIWPGQRSRSRLSRPSLENHLRCGLNITRLNVSFPERFNVAGMLHFFDKSIFRLCAEY